MCSSSWPPGRSMPRLSAGLVDPIYAIDKGAPISIMRLEIQLPPYAIEAKAQYKKLEDLKGKIVMADSPKGITGVYIDSMLAAHGIKPSEVDYVYTGSTGARFAALKTGAVDATILLPPFSFSAEALGFSNSGWSPTIGQDLPFTGAAVNTIGLPRHPALLKRFLERHNKSMAFFLDPKNRQESIDIMVAASKMKPRM